MRQVKKKLKKIKKIVAKKFNYFFVNVGPNLANLINKCNDAQLKGCWSGEGKVVQSMFLGEVSEN